MKGLPYILTTILIYSCGLTNGYKLNQHAEYEKLLTTADKGVINNSGELFKEVNIGGNGDFIKGTLRVIKTDNPTKFNFVEIGQWINHSKNANSGSQHNILFRDSIVYDSLGNSLMRTTYENISSEFILTERWTSTIKEDKFLQQIEIFDNNILVSEYTGQILNYLEPLSDRLKKRIMVGIRKDYSSDGKLKTIQTYDDSGKLIGVQKYSR